MKFLQHIRVAATILQTDFKAFKPLIFDKIVDMIIWVGLSLWVSAYILPHLGIQADYGLFMLGATAATVGVFETWPTIFGLMSDFEHGKITHYYATLPLPTWMVFGRMIVYYTGVGAFLSSLVLPLAWPILWGMFSWGAINWAQFIAIFAVGNFFFGTFALFVTSWVKSSQQVEHMWMRLIFPLWFLGGFQFSWEALHSAVPWLAYVNLANPILHITESYRTAIMGTTGALPFWWSTGAVFVITLAMACCAIVRLKRKLDFI